MKKLLCNSLVASVIAVAGATTFVSKAHAQSVDVDFRAFHKVEDFETDFL